MAKGGEYERDICKYLSMWVTRQMRDDIFWRTAGSGARATARMKKNMTTADSAGDMMAIAKYGKPYTDQAIWEFKRGYGGERSKRKPSEQIDPLAVLDNPKRMKRKPILNEWWTKITKEKNRHQRKFAFIIFKRDFKDHCIVMSQRTFDYIETKNRKFLRQMLRIRTFGYHLVIMRLDHFCRWCDPQKTFVTKKYLRKLG
jgi:hypothetical protein